MSTKTGNETAIMEAIIANPNSDNKKLVDKTGIGRETIRLTVKKLMAEGKIIANVSGKAMTFIAKEEVTSAKATAKAATKIASAPKEKKSSAGNDRTKIVFNGQELPKGQFVLAVIREEFKKGKNAADIQATYNNAQRKFGVVQLLADAMKKCQKQKRFFIRDDQQITQEGKVYAVCSDWGAKNIEDFMRKAKQQGYTFTTAKN